MKENPRHIRISEYNYPLADERIAKFPLSVRDQSKLLVYRHGEVTEDIFTSLPEYLPKGSLMIFNNTKVIQARLHFRKGTGALIEVFCLEPIQPNDYVLNFQQTEHAAWLCMVGNLKKWKEGSIECRFSYAGQECILRAEKQEQQNGEVLVRFSWNNDLSFSEVLEGCGRIPIPPYLNRESEESDEIRYQTVYSREEGSVAAPTAGLHFTAGILNDLQTKGVQVTELTLHVGAGTFRPVKAETIGGHDMHTEHLIISRQLVECLRRKEGDIIAVGTTSVRTLESLYWMGVKRLEGVEEFFSLEQWEAYTLPDHYTLQEAMEALEGWFDETHQELLKARTTIIIVPGYQFRVIDAMFTNFHQPQSTLLLLISAVVGEDWHKIYDYALAHDFRFLSYGDSSFLKVKGKK